MAIVLILGLILLFISVTLLTIQIIPERKEAPPLEGPKGEQDALINLLYPLIKYLAKKSEKLKINDYRKQIFKKMIRAGNPGNLTPDEFVGFKGACVIVSFFFPVLVLLLFQKFILLLFLIPVGGFFYPDLWLNDKIKARKKSITRALPDALDLLTLCVEAGLDFGAAINKVIEKSKQGPLTQELSYMLREIKLGKTRSEALRDMEGRVNVEGMTSFVSSLVQADKLGVSIGPVLRVQAEQMRTNRFLLAEKLAMEAPVKMLLPLLGCIFPAVFIMLLGPIALKLISAQF